MNTSPVLRNGFNKINGVVFIGNKDEIFNHINFPFMIKLSRLRFSDSGYYYDDKKDAKKLDSGYY